MGTTESRLCGLESQRQDPLFPEDDKVGWSWQAPEPTSSCLNFTREAGSRWWTRHLSGPGGTRRPEGLDWPAELWAAGVSLGCVWETPGRLGTGGWLGRNSRVGSWRGWTQGKEWECGAGEHSGSRTRCLCRSRSSGVGCRQAEGTALPKGAVFVGLMGSVGQHWPLLSVCLLFWPTLESEEGGEHLPPTPIHSLIWIRQSWLEIYRKRWGMEFCFDHL